MSESASHESDYEHVSDDEIGNSGQCDENGAIVEQLGATSVATAPHDTGNYATIPDCINVTHIQNTDKSKPKLENSSPAPSVDFDATSLKSDDNGYEAIPDDKINNSQLHGNKEAVPDHSDTAGSINDLAKSTFPDNGNYATIPCGTESTDIIDAEKTTKEDNPVSSVSNSETSVRSDESGYEAIPVDDIGQCNYGSKKGTTIQQLCIPDDDTNLSNMSRMSNIIRAEGKPGKFGHNVSITAVVHRPYL